MTSKKRNHFKAILFFFTVVVSLTCKAGTKGFNAIMISIGDESFRTSQTYIEFSTKDENDSCWAKMHLADGASGLKMLAFKKRPPEITRELGEAIWKNNQVAIAKARESLHKHPHDYDVSELHGLYIIKPEGNKISMMGIGINAGKSRDHGVSPKIEITIDPNDPKKSATAFEKGLCRVSKPFNIGFSI